jgi:hypothetical protein
LTVGISSFRSASNAICGWPRRLARCIDDPRCPDQVVHSLADMIGFRMKMIAAGYEDGNDANRLRCDPAFKMAQDALPSGRDLASQSTLCRLENLPGMRELVAMGRAMVDLYCASFRQVPKRIVLDIDDTFDAVHGGQQLRLFNAHHDEYGFQPMVVFDGDGRFVGAVLRPAKRPSGAEIRPHLRRLVRAIRSNWPNTRVLIRADSHYCSPPVIDWCRANGVDFILGVAPTTTLRKHVAELEVSTLARFEASAKPDKVRRFKEFFDGAGSWSRVERIIARVEVGAQGADTRFIVTNLAGGKAKALYEDVYCRRGAAENHSSRGRRISPPTAPPAQERRPTSSGCSCMPAPTGLCGACAPRCRSAPASPSPNSTRCVCASSRSPRGWSR